MKIKMNAHYGMLAHENEKIYAQGESEIYDCGAVEIPEGLTVYLNAAHTALIITDNQKGCWTIDEIVCSRHSKIRWIWHDANQQWHNVGTPWIKDAQPNPDYVAIINDRAGTDYAPREMSDVLAYQYAPELFARDDYYIGGEICDW